MTHDIRHFTPRPPDAAGIISWVHIGDLHMTSAGQQNDLDLQEIVREINAALNDSIAFAFLPGDVADQGGAAQYRVVRKSLDQLRSPWCAIVGDHDVHEKSFENFLQFMAAETHYAFTVGRIRFFALNAFELPDPGSFAVLPDQLQWLENGLQRLRPGDHAVLFLHCYPSDLKQGDAELQRLIDSYPVLLVDMGHTHYNEIANNGRVLYTATRSTGQIEEGPAGFSVTNVDGPSVSWKFFPLGTLPAVMITSPADERLIPEQRLQELVGVGPTCIRAKVFSAARVRSVEARLAGRSIPLEQVAGSSVYQGSLEPGALADGVHVLSVHLTDDAGKLATDEVRIVVGQSA